MDFFIITDMWHEKVGKFAAVNVKLQKLDLTKKSWWAEKGSPDPPLERDFGSPPPMTTCDTCGVYTMRIYTKGLMCVSRKCSQFGKIDGAEVEDPMALEYDDNFLSCRLQWNLSEFLQRAEFPLIPPVPNITPENQRQLQYGIDATKGMVCPLCSKCVPRVYFLGWKCDIDHIVGRPVPDNEKGCPWELMFKPSPIEIGSRPREEVETFHKGHKFSVRWQLPVDEDKTNLLPYHKYVFELPGGGTVTHFASNAVINTRDHGPDYLFHSLQASDLGLRRHRLSITNCKLCETGAH